MTELIQNIDLWLLHILNRDVANPVFDFLMPLITENRSWYLVYFFFLGWMFWKGGANGRKAGIVLLVAILITDPFCARIIKEWFGRIRPCYTVDFVRLLVDCGGGKSFPSNHAANNFAAAVVLSHFYRKYKWVFFTIAAFVAYSRVYVGVHYPFDIIGGALIGAAVGWGCVWVWGKVEKSIFKVIKK